jgi:dTDP-4-amino-4,6-dideoxygalactose transaminase
MAQKMRDFINHGENADLSIGLNLRMPELCAAVALAQLNRAPMIVDGRIEQAEAIIAAIGEIPSIRPPVVREGCRHVYYVIPFLIDRTDLPVGTADCDMNPISLGARGAFCERLRALGVPIVEGYQQPLGGLPAFKKYKRPCPVATDLRSTRLFYFENCAWSPTHAQIRLIGDAFKRAAEGVNA